MSILAATTQQAIGIVIAVVAVLTWLFYVVLENRRTPEENLESFMNAPNRKAPPTDEEFEGPRLDRFLGWGLLTLTVIAIALPLYWLAEPGRMEGSVRGFDKRSVKRGEELFLSTKAKPHPGFGCADCHGAKGVGGVAVWNLNVVDDNGQPVNDPATGKQQLNSVSWTAPALNTVALRYKKAQIRNVLIYGRGTNKPMPAWGVAGGGPMNDQQIDDLVNYLRHLAIEENPTALAAYNNAWDTNGHDADKAYDAAMIAAAKEAQKKSTDALKEYLGADANKGKSEGEALFELNCARCHTKGYSYGDPKTPGGGWFGPNLTGGSTKRQFPAEADQIDYVKNGVDEGKAYGAGGVQHFAGGGMPYFANVLTDEQIKAIVEYERSL